MCFLEPTVAAAQDASASAPPQPVPPMGVVCSNVREVLGSLGYPAGAVRQNLTYGQVIVEFTVTSEGQVANAHVLSSSNPVFERLSLLAVSRFKCDAVKREVTVRAPLTFELK